MKAPAGGVLFASGTTETGGTRNGYDSASLGSDESLGGALLTPIPWLRNGTLGQNEADSDGSAEETTQSSSADTDDDGLGDPIVLPSTNGNDAALASITTNGDPFVPERPEGAVTQGELIRMEQEAGVVPISANSSGPPPMRTGADENVDGEEMASEGPPHARGPDLVGAIDMGKVEGRNVEMRIGSPPQGSDGPSSDTMVAETGQEATDDKDYEMIDKDAMEVDEYTGAVKADIVADEKDKDEDMVLVDADGRMDDEATAAAASTSAEEEVSG
jgi:hypothetical protein